MLYKARKKDIKFLDDYSLTISEAKNKAKNKAKNNTSGKKLKIIKSNQMLQRIPIALAEVKAGTNLENLLNKIRQIVYSLD